MSVRLLGCQSDICSFTIQTLPAPYYCLSSTFSFIYFPPPHFVSCSSLSSSRPPILPSSRLSSALVAVHTRERQTGPLAAAQTGSSVRLCRCVSGPKEQEGDLQHYLHSFKLHQATRRPFFFYDCNMRYLTYRRHKAQQTRGSGETCARRHAHTYVTGESWMARSWRQMYV